MKRYTRVSSNAICIIPRKAFAWIILSLATLTIFSFMLIEVWRIYDQRHISQKFRGATNSHFTTSNVTLEITRSAQSRRHMNRATNRLQTKPPSNADSIEALFAEPPHCLDRPFLLILVASAPENFERREMIRNSWANMERWKLRVFGLQTKTVFLVGKSSTRFLNVLLKNEKDIAGDILIGEYLDTYRNLTRKVMHGFTWTLHHCQTTYLLKTDDDCFVNVPILVQFLWKYNPVPVNLYAGRVRWSAPVVRDPNSRWYVSSLEYSKQRYAPYANGAGYVLSYDVLEKLVVFSNKKFIFPNEDAYVGAVLYAAGVRPTYSGRFVTQPGPWQMCNFLYLFVIHRVKVSRQKEYQDMANKAIEHCSTNHIVEDWV